MSIDGVDRPMKRVSRIDEAGLRIKEWVPLTDEEMAQREADRQRSELEEAAREEKATAVAAARERLSYEGLARVQDDLRDATTIAALRVIVERLLSRMEDMALVLGIEDAPTGD